MHGGKLSFAQAADPNLVRQSFKLQFQLEDGAEGFEVWQTQAKDLRSKYCTFCVEKNWPKCILWRKMGNISKGFEGGGNKRGW